MLKIFIMGPKTISCYGTSLWKVTWQNMESRFNTFKNKPAAQAAVQTIPGATPPVLKIHPFSKVAVTFEPIQRFRCPSRFRISEKMANVFVEQSLASPKSSKKYLLCYEHWHIVCVWHCKKLAFWLNILLQWEHLLDFTCILDIQFKFFFFIACITCYYSCVFIHKHVQHGNLSV